MSAAPALLLAALGAAAAERPPSPPAPASPEVAACVAGADRVNEAARQVDDPRSGLGLEEARARTRRALEAARALEAEHSLRMPFLQRFVAECEKDPSLSDLAERLRFASERLRSSCRMLGRQAPPPAAVDRARAVAILSRPEYELRSRDEQLLARLLQRIWTWLRDVVSGSELLQKTAVSFRTFFLVATCLAVAYLAWRLSRVRLARRRAAPSQDLGAVALDDPARYEQDAGGALERGDGREAIRCGLLSLLSALERARLASPGRSATNREVALHVEARGGPPSLVGAVRSLVGFYDRAWYSLSEVPLDEARRFLGEARAARDEAARSRPKEAA